MADVESEWTSITPCWILARNDFLCDNAIKHIVKHEQYMGKIDLADIVPP